MIPKGHHKELLDQLLLSNDFSLSDPAKEKILFYIELLLKWNKTINLTAHRTVEEILEKDIIDSMYLNAFIELFQKPDFQGLEFLKNRSSFGSTQKICSSFRRFYLGARLLKSPKNVFLKPQTPQIQASETDLKNQKIIDMGCGAGFTGIVLAILNPHFSIGFLDSDRKKINFCKQAVRELDLQKGGIVPIFIQGRAENHPPEYTHYFNATVTRATWRFHEYIKHAQNYVQNSGQIIWLAGKNEKESSSEILDRQGRGEGGIIDYQIKPKNYKRKIFFFQKNPPQSFT